MLPRSMLPRSSMISNPMIPCYHAMMNTWCFPPCYDVPCLAMFIIPQLLLHIIFCTQCSMHATWNHVFTACYFRCMQIMCLRRATFCSRRMNANGVFTACYFRCAAYDFLPSCSPCEVCRSAGFFPLKISRNFFFQKNLAKFSSCKMHDVFWVEIEWRWC
jgi:hypothetical protein